MATVARNIEILLITETKILKDTETNTPHFL